MGGTRLGRLSTRQPCALLLLSRDLIERQYCLNLKLSCLVQKPTTVYLQTTPPTLSFNRMPPAIASPVTRFH